MKLRSPEDQLEFLIVNASRLVIKKYNRYFSEQGLSQSQITAMVHLDRAGPMNQSDLAKRIGLGKAGVGTLLEGLEQLGLIKRVRDTVDQRSIVVTLTREGKKRMKDVDVIAEELGTILRQGISTEERRAFIRTLNRLLDNLRGMS
jgi:DNA-binding MarR family transcriptional regulator